MTLDFAVSIIKVILFFFLYLLIGFGPGFVIGLLISNRVFGKDKPIRMDSHLKNIQKATEHNKQWHPDNPKWQ